MMGILRRWLELLGVPGRAPAGATRSPDPADHTTWDTHEWDFDVIQVPADGLPAVVLGFFEDLGLVRDPVHRAAIGSFVAVVQRHYSPQNPYHNFQHCVDVTHATFLMLVGIRAAVSDIECYALLLAALAHDLEHPGVNNAYLIKSRDPLAITYNDTSVLENRHAACLFEIVARYVVLEVLRSRSQPPMMTVPPTQTPSSRDIKLATETSGTPTQTSSGTWAPKSVSSPESSSSTPSSIRTCASTFQ